MLLAHVQESLNCVTFSNLDPIFNKNCNNYGQFQTLFLSNIGNVNQWREAYVYMNVSKFALAFDAWRGSVNRGVVAVTDISVTEGLCVGTLTPSPVVPVPPPVVVGQGKHNTPNINKPQVIYISTKRALGPAWMPVQNIAFGLSSYQYLYCTHAVAAEQKNVSVGFFLFFLIPSWFCDRLHNCFQICSIVISSETTVSSTSALRLLDSTERQYDGRGTEVQLPPNSRGLMLITQGAT